jgi:hypothetical protein
VAEILSSELGHTAKHCIVAHAPDATLVVIGPVFSAAKAEEIADRLRGEGYLPITDGNLAASVPLYSVAQLKPEAQRLVPRLNPHAATVDLDGQPITDVHLPQETQR